MFHIVLSVIYLDVIASFLTYIFTQNYSNKSRWFLLHAFANYYIMVNSYKDLRMCLKNPVICSDTNWNENSKNVFLMCTILHIYHCLFFKLTNDDILHHFMMLFICGPLTYKTGKITSSASLFFLSGLPGFIDYTLLWIVKCSDFNNNLRKYIYLMINLLIRSPGCLIFSYINVLTYTKEKAILSVILFWNAQYYLNQVYKSYYSVRSS